MARLPVRLARAAAAAILVTAAAWAALPSAHADPANSATLTFQAGSLDADHLHACVVLTGHFVRCWGYGHDGELGSDSTSTIGDTANSMENATHIDLPADVSSVS